MRLRTGKSGRYRYYTCSKAERMIDGGCDQPQTIREDLLDRLVVDHLSDIVFEPKRLQALLAEAVEAERLDQIGGFPGSNVIAAGPRGEHSSLERASPKPSSHNFVHAEWITLHDNLKFRVLVDFLLAELDRSAPYRRICVVTSSVGP